jgi:hypothetical protein
MKRRCAAALLLSIAILPGAAAAGQARDKRDTSAVVVGQAREALKAGRAADAVRLADTILVAAPGNRDAVDVKIRGLLALRDPARARLAYGRFLTAGGKADGQMLRAIAVSDLADIAANSSTDTYLKVDALDRLARAGEKSAAEELRRMASENAGTGTGVVADAALARQGDAAAASRLAGAVTSDRLRDKSIVADALRFAGARDRRRERPPRRRSVHWATKARSPSCVPCCPTTAPSYGRGRLWRSSDSAIRRERPSSPACGPARWRPHDWRRSTDRMRQPSRSENRQSNAPASSVSRSRALPRPRPSRRPIRRRPGTSW